LARLFATAAHTALPGREPMNPHEGQYRLAGTVRQWAALGTPTQRQRRALQLAYRGLAPRCFGRYGRRQWAAPLPWTRVVIKDPFAMLSLPAIVEATDARPVLLYRHPAAGLASYRRMGWKPDLDELRPVLDSHRAKVGRSSSPLPPLDDVDEVEAMAWFWSALYEMALDDVADLPACVIVAHSDVAGGGRDAARNLFELLGLQWTAHSDAQLRAGGDGAPAVSNDVLHNFDRSSEEAASGWRRHVSEAELRRMEELTQPVRELLTARQVRLRT
jgi:hypothetical protein